MKKLGIITMMVAVALSGCNGGSTEQTRTTVSDQNILSNARTPTSQTTTTTTEEDDDDATPPKSVSESNTDDNETTSTNSGSGDDPNSGFSQGR